MYWSHGNPFASIFLASFSHLRKTDHPRSNPHFLSASTNFPISHALLWMNIYCPCFQASLSSNTADCSIPFSRIPDSTSEEHPTCFSTLASDSSHGVDAPPPPWLVFLQFRFCSHRTRVGKWAVDRGVLSVACARMQMRRGCVVYTSYKWKHSLCYDEMKITNDFSDQIVFCASEGPSG